MKYLHQLLILPTRPATSGKTSQNAPVNNTNRKSSSKIKIPIKPKPKVPSKQEPKKDIEPTTQPPEHYNPSNATDLSMVNDSLSFNYQGNSEDKTINIVGGNIEHLSLTPYGVNSFYGYYTPTNCSNKMGIYYWVSINNGVPELDPQNSNVGIYKNKKCSYFLYDPTN